MRKQNVEKNWAIACLFTLMSFCVFAQNTINGHVILDVNQNARLNDPEDMNLPAVRVYLFEDLNGDGILDPGEPVIDSTMTDVRGNYSFNVPDGNYGVAVNTNDLPPDRTMLTPESFPVQALGGVTQTIDFAYQGDGIICYGAADNGSNSDRPDAGDNVDHIALINRFSGSTLYIGPSGTSDIEAIALQRGQLILYATNGGDFGIIDIYTGQYTRLSAVGTGRGALGNVRMNDIDGLTFDPNDPNIVYASVRNGPGGRELLFAIDVITGTIILDFWGPGIDYVVIDELQNAGDIDDIAIDPTTGEMYAIINSDRTRDCLVKIDIDPNGTPGAIELIRCFDGLIDVEGLGFTSDGKLYGSTGDKKLGSVPGYDYDDGLLFIDKETGDYEFIGKFPNEALYDDFEGLDCHNVEMKCNVAVDVTPAQIICGTPDAVYIGSDSNDSNFIYLWSPANSLDDSTSRNPLASPTQTTTYNVTVTNTANGGCSATRQVVVTVSGSLSIEAASTNTGCGTCNGTAAVSNINGGGISPSYNFTWSNNATTQSISGLCAGTYKVTVTSNGCMDSAIVLVSTTDGPEISVSSTDLNCYGQCEGTAEVVMLTPTTANYTYQWTISGQATDRVTGLCQGSYSVTVIDENNCLATDTFSIKQPPKLTITANATPATCGNNNGTAFVETIDGGTSPYSILWNNNETTDTIRGLAKGFYTVTVSDNNGCMADTSVRITNLDGVTADFNFETECDNFNVTFISASNDKVNEWHWFYQNKEIGTDPVINHTFPGAGAYMMELIVSDSAGICPDTISKPVIINEGPHAAFSYHVQCGTTEITFTDSSYGVSTGIMSWYWDFGNSQTSASQNSSVTYPGTGSFVVMLIVTDSLGCSDTAVQTVDVQPRCEFELWFPNAFTPDKVGNGPTPNNRARVRGKGIAELEVHIFDRWGELVYHTTDIDEAMNNGWDGIFKGERADVDSYAYYITARPECCLQEEETVFIKGSLTLLR